MSTAAAQSNLAPSAILIGDREHRRCGCPDPLFTAGQRDWRIPNRAPDVSRTSDSECRPHLQKQKVSNVTTLVAWRQRNVTR